MGKGTRAMAAGGALLVLSGLVREAAAEPWRASTAQRAPRKRPGHGKGPRAGAVAAPPAAPAASEPVRAELRAPAVALERLVLDNGLRVVLAPVKRAATVTVALLYDAGAGREERGSAGLANLMRYAMELGSANLLRGEHERHLRARGGRSRSEVTHERALYATTLPLAELPLGLWLEADRLKSLQLTSEGVSQQRDLMVADLQLRRLAEPLAPGRARLRELVFQSLWPYEHDALGSAIDVLSLKPEAVQPFYESFYTASNAVLVVAGDLEPESTAQLVRRFFETARRQDRPALPGATWAEPTSPRSARLDAPALRSTTMLYGWGMPSGRSDDVVAAEGAVQILGARLAARLQREHALASRVEVVLEPQRTTSLARLEIDLLAGVSATDLDARVEAEATSLAQRGPTEAELRQWRTAREASAWSAALDPEQLAQKLGDLEILHGDARLLTSELPQISAVGREKIRAASARYLTAVRRAQVTMAAPAATPSSAAAPPPPAVHAPGPLPRGHRPPRPPHPPRPKHR